ncbi:MAG: hypothetical protein EXR06_02685 [Rickettsiales bacterium]|nr:hypothetical protein [Rickettsiales bacterium]
MKIKLLAAIFTLSFATTSMALEASPDSIKSTAVAQEKIESAASKTTDQKEVVAKTEAKKSSTKIDSKDAKNIEDIKTFDFERIFREANDYFIAAQKWKTIKCIPQSMYVCSKHECPKLKLLDNAAIVIDKNNKTIALCRNKICQYYDAELNQTGVFVNVKVKGINGILTRILGDSRFKQISVVGLDAYITNGTCEAIE